MKSTILRNNAAHHRYELVDDGQVVCITEYALDNQTIRLLHTEVLPGNEGKGYGSEMAKRLLDEISGQKKQLVPLCEFIAGYVHRHPEYAPLIKPQ